MTSYYSDTWFRLDTSNVNLEEILTKLGYNTDIDKLDTIKTEVAGLLI